MIKLLSWALQKVYIYNNRGNAKYHLKQYNEAIKDYNQAIELNLKMRMPTTTEALQKLFSNNTTKP